MVDIDKLRGVPQGYTANSYASSKELKNAAILTAAVLTMAATPANSQAQNIERSPADDGHKIEMVSSDESPKNEENTIDYESAASMVEVESSLNHNDISIIYDKEANGYVIQGLDDSYAVIMESELEGKKIEKEEDRKHKQVFSEKPQINYQQMSDEEIRRRLEEDGAINLGFHDAGTNSVTVYRSQYNREEINEKLEEARKSENNDDIRFWSAHDNLKKIEENPELESSILAHEQTHRDSEEQGYKKETSNTPEQVAKLDMLDEIKATMNQAALGLEKFKQTGNMDDINGWHSGDLEDFKQWLAENPDKLNTPECNLKLAQSVYNGWLEKNNHKDSAYYNQATQNAGFGNDDVVGVRQAGAKFENDANREHYHQTVEAMFSDTRLGNVSSVINPDFKLGDGSKTETSGVTATNQAEQFLQAAASNANTVRQATSDLKDVLHEVRKADKDGVRTEKEQEKINQMIDNVLVGQTKQFDPKRKDGVTIAQKTGRARENGVMKKQDTQKTIVKENTNNSESILAMKNSNMGRG